MLSNVTNWLFKSPAYQPDPEAERADVVQLRWLILCGGLSTWTRKSRRCALWCAGAMR